MSSSTYKYATPESTHFVTRVERGGGATRRGAGGRASALRHAPSDSDCSAETGSLSDSGDKQPSTVRAAPPPSRSAKRARRRGSEWEVLEGLKDGQRFERRPEVFNGYLHKKRKWPLKGWHKRYFVVDGGILVYARGPSDVARGKLHGSVDVGLSVISAKQRRRRIDIDADEFIYHLRAKTPEVFRSWLNVLKTHRLYRQHLLTFGVREAAPRINAPIDIDNAESISGVTFSSCESFSSLSTDGECIREVQLPPTDNLFYNREEVVNHRPHLPCIPSTSLLKHKKKHAYSDSKIPSKRITCKDRLQKYETNSFIFEHPFSSCISKGDDVSHHTVDLYRWFNGFNMDRKGQSEHDSMYLLKKTMREKSLTVHFNPSIDKDIEKEGVKKNSELVYEWLNNKITPLVFKAKKMKQNYCKNFPEPLNAENVTMLKSSKKSTDLASYCKIGVIPANEEIVSNCMLLTTFIDELEKSLSVEMTDKCQQISIEKVSKHFGGFLKRKKSKALSLTKKQIPNQVEAFLKDMSEVLLNESRERVRLMYNIESIASEMARIASRIEDVLETKNDCSRDFGQLSYVRVERTNENGPQTQRLPSGSLHVLNNSQYTPATRKLLNIILDELSLENSSSFDDDVPHSAKTSNTRVCSKYSEGETSAVVNKEIINTIINASKLKLKDHKVEPKTEPTSKLKSFKSVAFKKCKTEVGIVNRLSKSYIVSKNESPDISDNNNSECSSNTDCIANPNNFKEINSNIDSMEYSPNSTFNENEDLILCNQTDLEHQAVSDNLLSEVFMQEVIYSPDTHYDGDDELPLLILDRKMGVKDLYDIYQSPTMSTCVSSRIQSANSLQIINSKTQSLLENNPLLIPRFFSDGKEYEFSSIDKITNCSKYHLVTYAAKSVLVVPKYMTEGTSYHGTLSNGVVNHSTSANAFSCMQVKSTATTTVRTTYANSYSSSSSFDFRKIYKTNTKIIDSRAMKSVDHVKSQTSDSKFVNLNTWEQRNHFYSIVNLRNEPSTCSISTYVNDFDDLPPKTIYEKRNVAIDTMREVEKDRIMMDVMRKLSPFPQNIRYYMFIHSVKTNWLENVYLKKYPNLEAITSISEPFLCSGVGSPTSGSARGPQAGFVSGTPGGRLGSWVVDTGGGVGSISRELNQAQAAVRRLQRIAERLERAPNTDASQDGASPNVKKDRRKFGLRKKKSQSSKGGSVDLHIPHHNMDGSVSHTALSTMTAPPSPGGGASSAPTSAASLPIVGVPSHRVYPPFLPIHTFQYY